MDSGANGQSEVPTLAVDEPGGVDLDRLWAIAKWFFLASVSFFVLFFIFHLFYENRCKRKRKESHEDERVPFEIKYRYKSQGGREGMNLMLDPYRTDSHSIVCVVVERKGLLAGICAFLGEGTVEFFLEQLPVGDCLHQLQAGAGNHVMAAISLWTKNWAFADSIEVLCSSWDLAQDINGKRRSEAAKLISTLEAKHNFSVNLQMADNFHCRGVDEEEMWTSMVQTAGKLLRQDTNTLDDQESEIWDDFDLDEWPRTRMRLSEDNLHALPHSGGCERAQKDVLSDINARGTVQDLVEL